MSHDRRNPIIVTGSHRSGSTWVGRVLATAPEIFYVHEPLNASFAPYYFNSKELPWFPKITNDDNDAYLEHFENLLSGRFPQINFGMLRPDRYLRYRLLHAVTFRWAAARRRRFLLKDPFALFSVEWFEEHFDADTVLLLRNPVGFVGSLKAKNWTFDFSNFLNQPRLMEEDLQDFRPAIEAAVAHPPGIVEQGCLLWNCLTARMLALATDPRRTLVHYEDLCDSPEVGFPELFQRLGLTWTAGSAAFVERNRKVNLNNKQSQRFSPLHRSVLQQAGSSLNDSEVEFVKDATAELARSLYPKGLEV
jgi:hypothetical protein